ncbi:MAG: HlyD family secretion protein [Phycisphaeraceae bacterium]|nr:HlyD family secretion protein [Phycisphaeraceae bacterium]
MTSSPTPEIPIAPANGSNGKRRIVALVVMLILLAGGAIFGIPWYIHWLHHASTDDAFIEGHIMPISPRVAGHVLAVHVQDNQQVQAGELLVELDPAPLQAQLAQAQAALEVAEAQLDAAPLDTTLTESTTAADTAEAQARLTESKAALEAAQATVEQAVAQLAVAQSLADKAHSDYSRYQRVFEQDVITEQDLEHAKLAAAAADAECAAATQQIAAAKSRVAEAEASVSSNEAALQRALTAPQQVAVSRARIPVLQAQVEAARAAVQQAELDLSYTKITAAADGWITRKSVEPGAYVQPGQNLMTVVPAAVWVIANYKETQLADIQVGQPVTMYVDTYDDHAFAGRVDSVMRGTGARFSLLPPENATGNYVKVVQRVPVKIVFSDPPDVQRYHLAPGMSVVPQIDITVQQNTTESEAALTP